MKQLLFQKRSTYLHVQRDCLAGLSIALLGIALLQTLLLFFKQERILVVPPELKQSYWVEGNRFSPSYIEEMALYFCHLLLDVTESNVLLQGQVLLRYVDAKAYGPFKARLLEDEKRLKKQQLSLHFSPTELKVDGLSAQVSGDLIHYVGSKKVLEARETYQLIFSECKGRLFLDTFKVVKSNQENVDEYRF